MPALLGVHLHFDSLGIPVTPASRISPDQPATVPVVSVVAVLFLTLRPSRTTHCRWDGATAVTSVWRGAAVGTLLCVAGAATLASIKWGLKDDGLICVATMVAALVAARVLAEAGRRRGQAPAGTMFGLMRNTLLGSYCALTSLSRG